MENTIQQAKETANAAYEAVTGQGQGKGQNEKQEAKPEPSQHDKQLNAQLKSKDEPVEEYIRDKYHSQADPSLFEDKADSKNDVKSS